MTQKGSVDKCVRKVQLTLISHKDHVNELCGAIDTLLHDAHISYSFTILSNECTPNSIPATLGKPQPANSFPTNPDNDVNWVSAPWGVP